MFRGREKELSTLREAFTSKKKEVILVYGKRRIGKSTLIAEALQNFNGVSVNHTCVRSSYAGNLSLFTRSICQSLELPNMQFSTIFDLFDFLKNRKESICIVIDEYQYWKETLKTNELDSYFQIICDALPKNIKLIFCGSYISIMKDLVKEDNPLFGRFTATIYLEEMNYFDSSLFYSNLSIQDKIAYYAIFGGSPYVLSKIDIKKSLKENVKKLLLDRDGILRMYIENVMLSEIKKSYDIRIFEVIGNGKKQYKDILKIVGETASGMLAKQLANLIEMSAIERKFPINKRTDKKKIFYEISDNLMKFYFAFIFGNESLITKLGIESFYKNYISKSLETFINLRFEQIVCQYFTKLSIKKSDILDIGSFWYDNPRTKKNGQFDCVIKTSTGYNVYEVKNYQKPMTKAQCEAEALQVADIEGLQAIKIGFVSSSGFDFKSKKYHLISGKDLWK